MSCALQGNIRVIFFPFEGESWMSPCPAENPARCKSKPQRSTRPCRKSLSLAFNSATCFVPHMELDTSVPKVLTLLIVHPRWFILMPPSECWLACVLTNPIDKMAHIDIPVACMVEGCVTSVLALIVPYSVFNPGCSESLVITSLLGSAHGM